MGHTRRSFLAACAVASATSLLRPNCLANVLAASDSPMLADRLAHDVLRPQFHLMPAANWMNDPNGPIYYRGQYHLFHQYNPNAAAWGDMHWAHAVSPDMVHWRHLPIALAPTPGGPDQDGCFSGSAVIYEGVPTFLYTGVATSDPASATLRDGEHNFRETQCLATSDDPELIVWKKLPKPVVPSPPPGVPVTGFRDPCVWNEKEDWYMAVGSGFPGKGGAVLLYRSRDLRRWEYLHPLVAGTWSGKPSKDPVDSGEMWECPDFFPLGGKHVLLYSTQRKVYWTIGEYDAREHVFHPQAQGLLDSGAFYAPKSMPDRDGNRILWGWIRETRSVEQYKAAGWAGAMSLPRVLTIGTTGVLEMRVAPAFMGIRGKQQTHPNTLAFENFSAEFSTAFSTATAAFSMTVGPNAHPYLLLKFDSTRKALTIYDGGPATAEIALPQSYPPAVNVHVYMDGSVVEIFINDQQAHTSRVYTLDSAAPETTIKVEGNSRPLKLWPIQPISPNRLTT